GAHAAAPGGAQGGLVAIPGGGPGQGPARPPAYYKAIPLRDLLGAATKKMGEPQPPHQDHRVEHAMLFPAPTGGGDALAQAQRLAHALEALAERDVFHQRDWGKATRRLERRATHEYRLVAGRNPGEPRADVHEPGDDEQQG